MRMSLVESINLVCMNSYTMPLLVANLLTVCFNVQCSCLLRLVFLRSGPLCSHNLM